MNSIVQSGFRFLQREHLKGREEIRNAFAAGKKVSCSGGKLFYLVNGLDVNRIAFTFARKYGNAVERNRSRRLSRESYRLMKHRLLAGFDFVLLIYPGGDIFERRSRQLDVLFTKAGLISEAL